MLVNFEIVSMGYTVGGASRTFELEIDKSELEGMTREEAEHYVFNLCREYVIEDIQICVEYFDLE